MATCPRCGADASGNFCSTCGASLEQRPCPTCGATPETGARFCNNCGAPLGAGRAASAGAGASAGARRGARRGGASRAKETAGAAAEGPTAGSQSQMGWWLAGVFFVGMILILALPILRRESSPGEPAPSGPTDAGTPPDLSTMTAQEAANRLFNRVMAAAEDGNTAEAQRFLPMAIQAHEQARPLDEDGLFHLSLLQQYGQDYTSALATAREILEANPDHLLGLVAAADAAKALGDSVAAREHYSRFLDVYDTEVAKGLTEYQEHQYNLGLGRQNAVAFTRP